MSGYEGELRFAIDLARSAAELALGSFGGSPSRRRKADGSWVTEADEATEAHIRRAVADTYPEHNILGEEEGLTAARGGPPSPGAPTWIVDPIDGTNNYMAGIPVWATLIALRVDEKSVVGVCHAPALGESYHAAQGSGAFRNGDRIHVSDVTELAESCVFFSSVQTFEELGCKTFFDSLISRSSRSRGFGDFWGHVLVAAGCGEVSFEPSLAVWDVAALEPIVTEAGGRLTGLSGEPFEDGGPCLTTNAALHDEVLELARASVRQG